MQLLRERDAVLRQHGEAAGETQLQGGLVEVREAYAEVHVLDDGLALRRAGLVRGVEVEGAPGQPHAPGLAVARGRGQAQHLQRQGVVPGGAAGERGPEVPGEEELIMVWISRCM